MGSLRGEILTRRLQIDNYQGDWNVTQQWSRLQGLMLSNAIDKEKLTQFLTDRAIAAEFVWNPKTAYSVSLRLASNGQNVGILPQESTQLEAGPTIAELANQLATEFNAEIHLEQIHLNQWHNKDQDLFDTAEETSCDLTPVRLVEIGTLPGSAVPMLAAIEGVDMAEVETREGKRALLAEVPAGQPESTFGDLPVVTLRMENGVLKAALIVDDNPDNAVRYDWGMQRVMVVGAAGTSQSAPKFLQRLVGARSRIEPIHDAVPGIDVEGACRAASQQGESAVREFVAALGLSQDIAEFLLGTVKLTDIADARVSTAGTIRSAIGRSVEKTLEGHGKHFRSWEAYSKLVVKHPLLMHVFCSISAIVGSSLIVLPYLRGVSMRKGWRRLIQTLGVTFLLDSAIQTIMCRYAETLHYRKEAERNRKQCRK